MPAGLLATDPAPLPERPTVRVRRAVNVAVTAASPSSGTTHVAVPLQAPDHPVNCEPSAAVAVSVTVVPSTYDAVQVPPQLTPAGEETTEPVPEPDRMTVSVRRTANVAVTVVSLAMVTRQVPVPVQPPPDQPVNSEAGSALAVSVTAVPLSNTLVQTAPHAIAMGLLATLPLPAPDRTTVSRGRMAVNTAVTAVSAFTVARHVPVPLQAPVQPSKVEPAAGVAVRVTAVPNGKARVQVAPHVMPAGLLVTAPVPVPLRATVSTGLIAEKAAPAAVAAVMVREQVPVPLHAPVQPVKVEPAAGVAVSVTAVL